MSDQERAMRIAAEQHAKELQRQLHQCTLHIDAQGNTIRTPKQQAAYDRELAKQSSETHPIRIGGKKYTGTVYIPKDGTCTQVSVHTCRG